MSLLNKLLAKLDWGRSGKLEAAKPVAISGFGQGRPAPPPPVTPVHRKSHSHIIDHYRQNASLLFAFDMLGSVKIAHTGEPVQMLADGEHVTD
jgi:hypothetical protein